MIQFIVAFLLFVLAVACLGLAFWCGFLMAENRRLKDRVERAERAAKAAESAPRRAEAATPPPAPAAVPPKPAAPAATQDDEPPPEIVAVITAAIAAMLRDRPFRIRRVRYAPAPTSSSWVDHGRSVIHASHRPGRK